MHPVSEVAGRVGAVAAAVHGVDGGGRGRTGGGRGGGRRRRRNNHRGVEGAGDALKVRASGVGLRGGAVAAHEDGAARRQREVVRRRGAVEETLLLLLLVVGVMVVVVGGIAERLEFLLFLLELETLLVLFHGRHLGRRQGADLARLGRRALAHGAAHRVGAGLGTAGRRRVGRVQHRRRVVVAGRAAGTGVVAEVAERRRRRRRRRDARLLLVQVLLQQRAAGRARRLGATVGGAAGSSHGAGGGAALVVLAAPRSVLVVGVLLHVDHPQVLCLFDVGPTVLWGQTLPLFTWNTKRKRWLKLI